MPLTTAHAALAWPLLKAAPRLPVAALVLGTFSPDFQYLLTLAPRGNFGHTPLGLLVFCVPLSLLAWAVHAALVRPAVIALLPPGVRGEIERDATKRTHKRWPLVLYAALAGFFGAVSHVVWDAFTHHDGWGVVRFPALAAEVHPRVVPGLRWYSFLQHASTVVGTLIIVAWLWRLARRFPPELRRYPPGQARRAVKVALGLGLASALAAALNGARVWGARLPVFLAYAAVGAMAGFAVAIALYGVWARLTGSRAATARAREG